MAHPIVHWEIGAKDGAATLRFYRELFGWSPASSMPGYDLIAADEGGIGGGIMQNRGDIPAYVTFYVAVDDLDATLEKAAQLGGKTLVPPTPIPNVGAFAMFTDPEERIIGLIKQQ